MLILLCRSKGRKLTTWTSISLIPHSIILLMSMMQHKEVQGTKRHHCLQLISQIVDKLSDRLKRSDQRVVSSLIKLCIPIRLRGVSMVLVMSKGLQQDWIGIILMRLWINLR